MLYLQLGVLRQKQDWTALTTQPLRVDDAWLERFAAGLPYALTGAQRRRWRTCAPTWPPAGR